MGLLSKLKEYVPTAHFTALKVTFVEKLQIIGKQTQTIDTDELQSAIERQSQPIIRSRGLEIDSKTNYGRSFDFLEIDLQNNGEGVAQNLYVRPSLRVSYGPDLENQTHVDIEEACFLTDGGIELGPRYSPLTRVEGDEEQNRTMEGGVLHPSEGVVTFSAQIEFQDVVHESNGGEERSRRSIKSATEALSAAGFHEMWFDLYVLYVDLNDNAHVEQVMGKTGSFDGGVTLEEIAELRFDTETGHPTKLLQRIEETYLYPP